MTKRASVSIYKALLSVLQLKHDKMYWKKRHYAEMEAHVKSEMARESFEGDLEDPSTA